MFFKKKIYFIRHGETEFNAANVRQGPEGHLSERGKAQADTVGRRFIPFPIRVILSSPYERAKETTEIINRHLQKHVEYTELLMERKNPSEVVGRRGDDPEVMRIIDRIDNSFHEDNLRFSDEENFADLKARADKLLRFLARRPERNILCVTHKIFLTMVVARLLYRDELTAEVFAKSSYYNTMNNAGVTLCVYNPWRRWGKTRGWTLVSWNDEPYVQARMEL